MNVVTSRFVFLLNLCVFCWYDIVMMYSKFAKKAAWKHKVPIPKDSTWVESIPFGVFAEGVSILSQRK